MGGLSPCRRLLLNSFAYLNDFNLKLPGDARRKACSNVEIRSTNSCICLFLVLYEKPIFQGFVKTNTLLLFITVYRSFQLVSVSEWPGLSNRHLKKASSRFGEGFRFRGASLDPCMDKQHSSTTIVIHHPFQHF